MNLTVDVIRRPRATADPKKKNEIITQTGQIVAFHEQEITPVFLSPAENTRSAKQSLKNISNYLKITIIKYLQIEYFTLKV
jgi:hypothetical protein